MVIKFNPAGRVVMVLGRRPEPVAGATQTSNAQNPLRARTKIPVRPADRRHVGCARQHLRVRRLRQFARREVRQERPFHRVSSRASAGSGAEPAEHAALDCVRRAGQHLRRRSRQPPHRRSEQRPHAEDGVYDNVGNPWAVCISPAPHQYLFVVELESRQQTPPPRGRSPARSTRWSSTARSSASSARRARASASSAPCTRSTAATRTSSSCRRSRHGARRRSS